MKIFMTIVRVTIALLAAVVLFVVPFWVSGPGGTSLDTVGATIDLIAAVVFVAVLVWMWRDRANLA